MKKSLLEIYSLAVCFITIICFAVALGVGIYDVLEMTVPDFTLKSHAYEQHQTNEAFTRRWKEERRTKYTDDEITALRQESYDVSLSTERRDAFQSCIRVGIIVVIDLIIFLLHWMLAKRARQENT